MNNQLSLFELDTICADECEDHGKLLIGGIYRDDNDDPDYDGCYALCMGSNRFYFIFNEITHIEEIVEIGCAHKMRKMDGYALGIKRDPSTDTYEWQIRDSSRKHTPEYILQKGSGTKSFYESLDRFKKVFMK